MALEMVRNKRLKISPGGVITLPVAARKALGMKKGLGARVGICVEQGEVIFTGRQGEAETSWRISSKGMLLLKGQPREILASGKNRHFWLKLADTKQEVRAVPFRSASQ